MCISTQALVNVKKIGTNVSCFVTELISDELFCTVVPTLYLLGGIFV